MNVWDVILRLYDAEINAGLQTDWDGGITVWLGGPPDSRTSALSQADADCCASVFVPLMPIVAKATFLRDESDQAAHWLNEQASRCFPALAKTLKR